MYSRRTCACTAATGQMRKTTPDKQKIEQCARVEAPISLTVYCSESVHGGLRAACMFAYRATTTTCAVLFADRVDTSAIFRICRRGEHGFPAVRRAEAASCRDGKTYLWPLRDVQEGV